MRKIIITAILGVILFAMSMCSRGGGDEENKYYCQPAPQGPPETTFYSVPLYYCPWDYAQFLFGCNLAGCSFECDLDSKGFAPCSSPIVYDPLSEGWHTLSVRAIDSLGNPDPTPATYRWWM